MIEFGIIAIQNTCPINTHQNLAGFASYKIYDSPFFEFIFLKYKDKTEMWGWDLLEEEEWKVVGDERMEGENLGL